MPSVSGVQMAEPAARSNAEDDYSYGCCFRLGAAVGCERPATVNLRCEWLQHLKERAELLQAEVHGASLSVAGLSDLTATVYADPGCYC